jgi:hypothetical protein
MMNCKFVKYGIAVANCDHQGRYSTTGSLPAEYKNVAEGPYNSGNIREIIGALASPDPSKHLQRISNATRHAFRVNSVTYYKKKP